MIRDINLLLSDGDDNLCWDENEMLKSIPFIKMDEETYAQGWTLVKVEDTYTTKSKSLPRPLRPATYLTLRYINIY